ncbi:RNA polymerase sigma factor [Pedobacter duraquae]|uniref:RNA polymerase sigma-70 factor (ECF subfamily) n=1 Tax=Pedobacter duraquae TaxID=425511 RepID=A0A4R6II66_9SPHI|nr:sigma-70 family RNA polymerase sigma factor [Pedobacter duraquae]TDO21652.1 RNA polymerase sigma-70 factor (ECF subfamily) [Pedobacter duraquae]
MSGAEKYTTDDRVLLLEMQADSIAAFDAIYERYWELVYSAAYKRLRNSDLSKDITQDIFLKLWSGRNKTTILNLPAYLHTSVRNNVFKLLEKEQRYTPIPELMTESESAIEGADAALLRKDFVYSYDQLLNQLTASQQQIFRMRFDQDQSTTEISAQLGISRKTVQNQLGRSIAFLKASLAFTVILILPFLF